MRAVMLALTIVSVVRAKSLYELRKHRAWDVDDGLFVFTSDVLSSELQKNYNNADIFESRLELKRPTDVVYAAPIRLKWIFAATCFEHLVGDLLAYTGTVVELLETQEGVAFDQKTVELIGFDECIYSVPTFLFDAGYRKLEPIFDVIHFFRSLALLPPANSMTAQTKLRKFIKEYSYIHGRETAFENNPGIANRAELEKKCLDIKTKITNLSKIFFLNTTPLINTMFFDQTPESDHTNRLLEFDNYIYETEKCIVYVSMQMFYVLLVLIVYTNRFIRSFTRF